MAEILISVVGPPVAERVADSIATRVGYIRNYKANFEDLDKQVKNLQGRRDEVQHKVVEDTRNGRAIHKHVQNWLVSVNNMIEEVTGIIEDNKRQNMRCFKSLCPDLKKRYQQSKIARMKTDDVSKLHNEGTFDTVSYRTLPAETWLPDSYENINSRHSIVEDILDALQDRDVNMIGVHGMGGSGKTTLVRQVAKKAEQDELFNPVVFAEVSDTVDIRKIQVVIAGRLGLKFDEDIETIRADRLRERIMQETKILLILDNIWKDLDLAAVGIPFGNNHVGCKLLLTSRDMDLLNEMGSESNFKLDVLEGEEACNLFMKIAGVGEEQHGLRSSAFDVAKACGGLLVAIFTVAKALKNKEQCDWDTALRKLNNPPPFEKVEGLVLKKAYMSIYLSYENLESEELKSTFSLCSIMACTHDASIEELLRYAVGLRLFKEENTMEDVREKAKESVRKLKDLSLLLGTRNSETFSIHDVVRDVGRWIARKDQHKFTVIDNVIPRQWADENTLQNCTSITLHDISELPKRLECPQLQFFYMKTKTRFTQIPDNFFKGMPNLIVLHLIEMYLSPLPASLRLLKKLRTLNLDWCHLGDIAEIKDMENLEILVIGEDSDTKKKLLPEEIGQLNRLRVLDLRNSPFIIPSKTISRLTELEELYMGDWYDQREVEESVASLEELKDLSQLTALHIRVADAEILPKGLDFFKKLKRYKIVIGEPITFYFSRETLRTLHVTSDTNICSEDGVINHLKGIEDLHLGGKQRVKNILYELDGEGFPQLKRFHIENNPYIQLIVDSIPSATGDAFPLLETLSLYNLVRLEKICHDQLRAKCFCQLTTIKVKKCGKLKNLFSFSIAKHLSQLQKIEVDDCENMEEIFSIGRTDDVNNNEVVCGQLHSLTLRSLPRLRRICSESGIASPSQERLMPLTTDAWEDQVDALPLFGEKITDLENLRRFHSVNLFEFPSLKDLEIKNCPGLKEFIFDDKVGLPNLERMTISCMDNLESIWQDQLDWDSFRKLKSLEVNDCQMLMTIFSSSIWERFLRLESLTVKSCGLVEAIFQRLNFDHPEASQLRELYIDHLPNLNHLWKEDPQGMLSLENLQKVTVFLCPNLKNIFPASVARSLLGLECLEVSDCNVEEIIARGGEGEEAADMFLFPGLSSMQLHCLPELKIVYPGHSVEWPYLKRLGLHHCDKVKVFISELDNPTQQLFLKSEDLLNVEDLQLSGKATVMKGQEDLFGLLQILELNDDKSTDFSLDIIQRYPKLKKLSLNCSSYEEIFSHGDVEKRLPQIKHLVLSELYDLKRIWKQDSKVHPNFQNLESLKVRSCFNLINLMPSSASFQNLTILEVWGCEGLKNLFTTFTAKSLEQLEKLEVFDCKMMTEVVVNKEAVTDEITFKKLKRLSLLYLQSLASFCSVKYILKFPILESLVVNECPKMKIFSGATSAPRLRKLELNWKLIERSKEIDQIIQRDMEKRLAGREDCDDSTSIISDRTNC